MSKKGKKVRNTNEAGNGFWTGICPMCHKEITKPSSLNVGDMKFPPVLTDKRNLRDEDRVCKELCAETLKKEAEKITNDLIKDSLAGHKDGGNSTNPGVYKSLSKFGKEPLLVVLVLSKISKDPSKIPPEKRRLHGEPNVTWAGPHPMEVDGEIINIERHLRRRQKVQNKYDASEGGVRKNDVVVHFNQYDTKMADHGRKIPMVAEIYAKASKGKTTDTNGKEINIDADNLVVDLRKPNNPKFGDTYKEKRPTQRLVIKEGKGLVLIPGTIEPELFFDIEPLPEQKKKPAE